MRSHIKTLLIIRLLLGVMACFYDRCCSIYQTSEFPISIILSGKM